MLSPIHELGVSAYEGFVSEALSSPSLSFLVSDLLRMVSLAQVEVQSRIERVQTMPQLSPLEAAEYFSELVAEHAIFIDSTRRKATSRRH